MKLRKPRRPARRSWKARRYWRDRRPLERREAEIIMADLREMGGSGSARELMERFPQRYDPKWLPGALARMARHGYLHGVRRQPSWWGRFTAYSIRADWPARVREHQQVQEARLRG